MRLNGNPQLIAKKTTKSVRECIPWDTSFSHLAPAKSSMLFTRFLFYKKRKMGLRAKSFLNFWHFKGKRFLISFLIFFFSVIFQQNLKKSSLFSVSQ